MATCLLIHGAWHGGWCWRKVLPLVERKGHVALAPDLPGHGDDKTPTAAVTLQAYADRIWALPAMAEWVAAAKAEKEEIEELEVEF